MKSFRILSLLLVAVFPLLTGFDNTEASKYPMIGKTYLIDFGKLSGAMTFVSETRARFASPATDTSTETKWIKIRKLREGLYTVSWKERNGDFVLQTHDYENGTVHSMTIPRKGTIRERNGKLSMLDVIPGQTLPAMLHMEEQMPDTKAVEKEIQK